MIGIYLERRYNFLKSRNKLALVDVKELSGWGFLFFRKYIDFVKYELNFVIVKPL